MDKRANIDAPDLVRRIQDGDRSAEEELVRFYLPSLRLILYRRYSDPELVQDVVQDAFIAVIENLRNGKIQKPAALTGYVRSIALNKANERLRGERRSTSTSPDRFDALDSATDLLQNLETSELSRLTRRAIDGLNNKRDRELILLFYYYDVDKALLCDQFEVSPAHFDRIKYRALKRLQKIVEGQSRKALPVSMLFLMVVIMTLKDGKQ